MSGIIGVSPDMRSGVIGAFPAGMVIQVVSFLTNLRGNFTADKNDVSSSPAIAKAITPKASGSSFYIKIRWLGECTAFESVHAHLHRDGSRVNATNDQALTPDHDFMLGQPFQAWNGGSDFDSTHDVMNFSTLDETGSTAGTSTTFELKFSSNNTAGRSIYTNRCAGNVDYSSGNSEIIIKEIAG